MTTPVFGGAVVGTITTIAVVLIVRMAARGSGITRPEDALPVLISTAALLVAVLTWRRAATIAWLAVVVAGTIATVDLAVAARALRDVVDATAWRWLTVAIGLAALWTSGVAVAYAAERRRRLGRWVLWAGVAGVALVAAATVWAIAQGAPTPDPGGSASGPTGLLTRTFLVVTTLAVGAGLMGDAREPLARARRRTALADQPDRAGSIERLVVLGRAFADEVAPGRARARHAAVAERARIARDLHAEIVPGLRRAVALAEGGDDLAGLAAQLRRTLADVEGLGAAEHPIQLETGGLLSAIEALAESVEAGSDVKVTIDVVERSGASGEPPPDVAAAVLRVTRLALDNVVRHAPGARVTVTIDVDRDAVRLTVVDDGPGLDADARARAARAGHRGLVDMAAEAAATGAALEVGRIQPAGGTRVWFGWGPLRAS